MLQGVSYLPKQIKNAVVLLHGYGADGADLLSLTSFWQHALPHTAFFAPNAPKELPFGGYEWFSLDDYDPCRASTLDYARLLKERALKSVPFVMDYIKDVCQSHQLTTSNIVLGGFSQGGLMSFLSAYQMQTPFAGIIGMSAVPLANPVPARASANVLLTHGTADEVVPFAAMSLSQNTLTQMNQKVETFIVPEMGHNIDMNCIKRVELFLKTVLD